MSDTDTTHDFIELCDFIKLLSVSVSVSVLHRVQAIIAIKISADNMKVKLENLK